MDGWRLVLSVWIYVVLVETCASVPVSEDQQVIENSINNGLNAPAVGSQSLRRRRASPIIISKAVIEGITAVKKLISGARKIPTSKDYRMFEKPCNFDKAVNDFESLSPHGTQNFKMPAGAYGKAGRVGDRLLVLQSKGESGKPTLNIMKIEDVLRLERKNRIIGQLTDIITYND